MRRILLFLIGFQISGCALFHAQEIKQPAKPKPVRYKQPDDLSEGMEHLKNEHYEWALEFFNKYIAENNTSRWFATAYYNKGMSLEGLEHWTEAISTYRHVVQISRGRNPELEARALYRLSFAYEAIADDGKTIAALLDLQSRKIHLPVEIRDAELPARLAAAYARVGNLRLAHVNYAEAEAGIAKLRRQRPGAPIPWLPRTLYYMGYMSIARINTDNFESFIRPLKAGQVYLLRAAEMEQNIWSERSAYQLMQVYRDTLGVIENLPPGDTDDPVLAQREKQRRQWEMSAALLESLEELNMSRRPAAFEEGGYVYEIFEFTKGLKGRLIAIMNQVPAGSVLTKEALKYQGIRRKGKVVDQSGVLEQKSRKLKVNRRN